MIIAFTGPRPHKIGGYDYRSNGVYDKVAAHILSILTALKPEAVICGGAMGVDMIASEMALLMGVPLVIAEPYQYHYVLWPENEIKLYKQLKLGAAIVYHISPVAEYSNEVFQQRNEFIVDNANLLIGYDLGEKRGGTYNCIQYAQKAEKLRSDFRLKTFNIKNIIQ